MYIYMCVCTTYVGVLGQSFDAVQPLPQDRRAERLNLHIQPCYNVIYEFNRSNYPHSGSPVLLRYPNTFNHIHITNLVSLQEGK